MSKSEMGGKPTEAENLADSILRASGSALRHYTMHKTRQEIIAAAQVPLTERDRLKQENAEIVVRAEHAVLKMRQAAKLLDTLDYEVIASALRVQAEMLAQQTGKEG